MRALFDDMGNKRCPCCKEYKEPNSFRKSKHSKNGTISYCRPCMTKLKADKRALPESKIQRRRQDLYTKYRLTPEDYIDMFHSQEGKCCICTKALNKDDYRRTVVDHCHCTKKVRGLLCINCNIGLGAFKDSLESLERARQYIMKGGIK